MKKLSLLLFLVLLWGTAAHAQTQEVFVDFENGIIPEPQGPGFPVVASDAAVPRAILIESGNRFLRQTASPTDCGPLFATTCPLTRATVGPGWSTITDGQTVTYSWDMRIPSTQNPQAANQNGMVMQTFQDFELPGGDAPI